MSDEPGSENASDGEDYIYRGDDEPDATMEPPPMPPPMPPSAGPPRPPGAPPSTPPPPPGGPEAHQYLPTLEKPKRKRWPWLVAALVIFCALPLGGCIALISFGLSEIGEREDAIDAVAVDFMSQVVDGRSAGTTGLMDGGPECLDSGMFVRLLENELPAADEWQTDDVSFVDRDGNSYLANVSEADEFVHPGREADGIAIVSGRLLAGGSTTAEVQVLLLKPRDRWLVCQLGVL